MSTVIEFF